MTDKPDNRPTPDQADPDQADPEQDDRGQSALETPEQAASAFYTAFAARNLEAMMAVWSDAEDVTCIHPLAYRIQGSRAVRLSWEQIFRDAPPLRFQNNAEQLTTTGDLAVQTLHEIIVVEGESSPHPAIIATNVFRRDPAGWRIILHHAGPLPDAQEGQSGRRLH